MAHIIFAAGFLEDGDALTSAELTGGDAPTVSVIRVTRSDNTEATVITGAATTYSSVAKTWRYKLASADTETYEYHALFTTTYAGATQKDVWARGSIDAGQYATEYGYLTGDSFARLGAPAGASIAADLATVDTVVDAIKAVTDNLPNSGSLSDLAAILEDTGTTIPALIAALNDPTAAAVAAAVWTYATRTLTQTSQQIAAAIDGSTITVHRGDHFSEQLTDLGAIPVDRTKFWFTVKTDPENDADTASILQVEETDGLLYLNGAAASDDALASVVIDDEATGDVTLTIKDTVTADLGKTIGISYDFQYLDVDGNATTLASGTFVVNVDVTRAVS